MTKNELTLGELQPASGVTRDELILAAALSSRRDAPDAIDAAILVGAPLAAALDAFAVRDFHPFDPVVKRAEAEIEHDGKRFEVAKGAPQVIVDLCEPADDERRKIAALVDEDAAKGFRTLGVARTDESGHWHFLGLVPLFDPPRDDCAETIKATRAMDVDIKMVTGDHEAIAREIAGQVGLGQTSSSPTPYSARTHAPTGCRASSPPTASRASSPSISSRSSRPCKGPGTSSA